MFFSEPPELERPGSPPKPCLPTGRFSVGGESDSEAESALQVGKATRVEKEYEF